MQLTGPGLLDHAAQIPARRFHLAIRVLVENQRDRCGRNPRPHDLLRNIPGIFRNPCHRPQLSRRSARFANRKDLKKLEGPNKLGSNAGLLIGRDPHTGRLLRYDGPAHVLDPFEVTGIPSAAYNPLDRLSPDSLDLGEDAASLTEALVMDAPGQVSEAHWNEEAKAILGRVDHVLRLPRGEEPARAGDRAGVPHPAPGTAAGAAGADAGQRCSGRAGGPRAANRFLGKADREAASVLSNAQRHTHFLDSPRIARVLSRSDFHFSELRLLVFSGPQ